MTIPEYVLREADEAGVKLEIVNGLGIWEGMPVYRHQKAARRIENCRSSRPDSTNIGG